METRETRETTINSARKFMNVMKTVVIVFGLVVMFGSLLTETKPIAPNEKFLYTIIVAAMLYGLHKLYNYLFVKYKKRINYLYDKFENEN